MLHYLFAAKYGLPSIDFLGILQRFPDKVIDVHKNHGFHAKNQRVIDKLSNGIFNLPLYCHISYQIEKDVEKNRKIRVSLLFFVNELFKVVKSLYLLLLGTTHHVFIVKVKDILCVALVRFLLYYAGYFK